MAMPIPQSLQYQLTHVSKTKHASSKLWFILSLSLKVNHKQTNNLEKRKVNYIHTYNYFNY